MNPFDRLLGMVGLSRKASSYPSVGGFSGADPFTLWATTKKIEAQKAMGVYNNWVYACVRAIAEEIANADFRLFQIKRDGTHEELFDHEILTALGSVNGYQTAYELRYLLGSHLELAGNAYWLLDGVKNAGDKPTAIYPLNPSKIVVVRGDLKEPVRAYKYTDGLGGKAIMYQPHEILHFKYPDPNDVVEGIGTVQSIAQWIDADNYATEFNRRFFLNGARIGGFLESESAHTTEQLTYLKKSFEDIFRGVDNAYKIAALPKGVKYTPGGESQKEMDFVESQKQNREKILAGFRVPKTILGSSESETNRATAETANYVFAARTITPKLKLLSSYLNEFFVPRYGDDLYIEFANIIPEDKEQRVKEMVAGTAGQAVMSVNEAREEYLGRGPVENGEDVTTDFSRIPLGAPTKSMRKPTAKQRKIVKMVSRFARNAQKRKDIASDVTKAAIAEIAKLMESSPSHVTKMSDDDYEVVWKGFVTRVTPYEKKMQQIVQGFNNEQLDEVLGNLAGATKAKGVDTSDLFDLEDWVTSLVDLAKPLIYDLYGKEGAAAAKLLGRDDIDVLTPETRTALDNALGLMSRKYNETTLELLKTKLEEGLQDGLSQPELKKLVQEIYEFSDESRAIMVARTETFRVANGATHQAWKQSGVVKTYRWYTAVDERVCEFCGPMMQKDPIGIDDLFFKDGETITGENGGTLTIDYSDVEFPPLHPNCRCYVRPDTIEI